MLVGGNKGLLFGMVAGGAAAGAAVFLCGRSSCTASRPSFNDPNVQETIQNGKVSEDGKQCCGSIIGTSSFTCMEL